MRIPRFWHRLEADLIVDGHVQRSGFLGHSEHSDEEARQHALDRVRVVQARIDANDGRRHENYEVAIREEILDELSAEAIVTRNRYGAEVLNCARLVIIDVDRPPDLGFWKALFGREKRSPKQRMLEHIRMAIRARPGPYDHRVYETRNGYRVIVVGADLPPADDRVRALFAAMNCDPVYALLCRRQDCYRARLTPKPSRIRQKAIQLKYPYTPEKAQALHDWLPDYNALSERFAVCRLVEVIGRDDPDRIVRYHDQRTRACSDLPLA